MNDKSGVWGAASSGESPGRREMLLLRLVVTAHLAENPLLLMDLVVNFNSALDELLKACWESDLV